MKRKLLLLPFLFLYANIQLVSAQYDDIRFPRNENEINRIKSFKIKKEIENSTESGQEIPYALNYFDAEGRIIRSINPEARSIFSYDVQGRLSSRVDSVAEGRKFRVDKYAFEYDAQGQLKSAKLPGGSSVFRFMDTEKIVEETLKTSDGKITYKSYYYNESGKLKEEVWRSADSTIQKRRKLYLNKKNLPVAEVIISASGNGKLDSMHIFRIFDINEDIVKKQVTVVNDYKNTPLLKKESRTYVYTYDPKGNVTSESCTSSIPSTSFKNEWSYTGASYPAGKVYYDGNGKPVRRFSYRYDFWNKF